MSQYRRFLVDVQTPPLRAQTCLCMEKAQLLAIQSPPQLQAQRIYNALKAGTLAARALDAPKNLSVESVKDLLHRYTVNSCITLFTCCLAALARLPKVLADMALPPL
eukprot:3163405-Amphidinium_carterae.1